MIGKVAQKCMDLFVEDLHTKKKSFPLHSTVYMVLFYCYSVSRHNI